MSITTSRHIAEVLQSSGPSSELGIAAEVYDWLIGSWDVRVIDYEPDGSQHENRGEWHFEWVLEGRAIQDVFVVPVRNARNSELPKEWNRYGTTLRVYDPEIKAWRIAWINPVRTVETHLVGRKVGDEIVQDGVDKNDSMQIKWCFRNITKDSFRWTGEESNDGGKSWFLSAEFFANRIK